VALLCDSLLRTGPSLGDILHGSHPRLWLRKEWSAERKSKLPRCNSSACAGQQKSRTICFDVYRYSTNDCIIMLKCSRLVVCVDHGISVRREAKLSKELSIRRLKWRYLNLETILGWAMCRRELHCHLNLIANIG
jgi:hypothetical protein